MNESKKLFLKKRSVSVLSDASQAGIKGGTDTKQLCDKIVLTAKGVSLLGTVVTETTSIGAGFCVSIAITIDQAKQSLWVCPPPPPPPYQVSNAPGVGTCPIVHIGGSNAGGGSDPFYTENLGNTACNGGSPSRLT